MDFKAYSEHKRKEAHMKIITDICMTINNCADCINDETRKTDCYPLSCVNLYDVTADSFYMEIYDNSKTNRELLDIAEQNGYKAGFVEEEKGICIKFWRNNIKPYTIFYDYDGTTHHNVWDAETLEEAIETAKYQLEDCKVGYTVLEDMTRELKENQY